MARVISETSISVSCNHPLPLVRILKLFRSSSALRSLLLHWPATISKMNSAGCSEACSSSNNHPIPQHNAEIFPSSSLSSNETGQRQKRSLISLSPILRHLGLERAKASNEAKQGTSSKNKPSRLNPSMTSSSLSVDCKADPPLHSFNPVSGNKGNLRNKEISYGKSQSQTDETSEQTIKSMRVGQEQCSSVIIATGTNASSQDKGCIPQNVVSSIDQLSSPSRFGNCKPSQAKRSQMEHPDVKSPSRRNKQDLSSGGTECNKVYGEATNTIAQLQLHSVTRQNNGSQECDIIRQMAGDIDLQNYHSLPNSFGKQKASRVTRLKPGLANHKDCFAPSKQKPNRYQKSPPLRPFDICESDHEFSTTSEIIFAKDEKQGSQMCQPGDWDHSRVLTPGMVLLKGYLTEDDQVSVVRDCRNLGIGTGGFYQPGYKDGAKLRLMMMCLGHDWDPQTRKYSNRRRLDNSRPPGIPCQFLDMVSRAIIASQALTKREYDKSNVADILPMMSPDICIVNFYATTGRLGLHQDRDESPESLDKGLPVVSMSVGDSAEFLYGDVRNISKAEKVVLESGDVLIFGGKSRHIFHGVERIIPGSAPESLLEETRLRPGRLNLTFRQF